MNSPAYEKEIHLYEKEIQDTLGVLWESTPSFLDAEYFARIAVDYYDFEKIRRESPKVIVLGSSIPEEIVHATGITPHWVLGGSLGTTAWADDLVPRDTDAVYRSIYGFLMGDMSTLAKDALIIVPTVNDSSRKLAYLLKLAGHKVHTVDLPPDKDAAAVFKWRRQLEQCCEALSAHTGKWITQRALRQAARRVCAAHSQMRVFYQYADSLPGAFRMFILGSYYYAKDITEWTAQLAELNRTLKNHHIPRDTCRPNALLLGSPVYFPNFKIPFLMQDIGLNICLNVDYTTQKVLVAASNLRMGCSNLADLAQNFFQADCSSAYISNNTLHNSVAELVGNQQIDGVVYHVLKGQIEYDFEFERFESVFAESDIPVFRLETDYKYQDVEQLRIRMEAFMEMLTHRQVRKGGYAV